MKYFNQFQRSDANAAVADFLRHIAAINEYYTFEDLMRIENNLRQLQDEIDGRFHASFVVLNESSPEIQEAYMARIYSNFIEYAQGKIAGPILTEKNYGACTQEVCAQQTFYCEGMKICFATHGLCGYLRQCNSAATGNTISFLTFSGGAFFGGAPGIIIGTVGLVGTVIYYGYATDACRRGESNLCMECKRSCYN